MKILKSIKGRHIYVFIFYCILVFIANWSLLIGENYMKYDIMDAHYPNSIFLSNCIQNGTLPLWNPLARYGIPYYTTIGGPVWYPSTIILALLGYPLICVGIEYCIHIVIACFGTYLLTYSFLEEKANNQNRLIAVIAGVFYGFSGLFLSNAQHIMIIISAAWLPFVLYFLRRFIQSGKKSLLLIAGYCGGLSVLGGYPELWVAMFIILVPYCIWQYEGIQILRKRMGKAFLLYCAIGICTVFSSAVTLLPFIIGINNFSRMSGGGMIINSFDFEMLISTFLPTAVRYRQQVDTAIDISMTNMYMGIFCLLTIPNIIRNRSKKTIWCGGIAIFAFLMIMGNHLFLHPIFYRFFPMFKMLRFPSTWRCILTIFLLILWADAWRILWQNHAEQEKTLKVAIKAAMGMIVVAVLISLMGQLRELEAATWIIRDLWITGLLFALYGIVLYGGGNGHRDIKGLLFLVVILEVLTFQYQAAPITMVKYKPTKFIYDEEAREAVNKKINANAERVCSVDFAGALRSQGGFSHLEAVLNGTFDEQGYTSIDLSGTERYIDSINANITRQNPEIYFTGNVTDGSEGNLQEWLGQIANDPSEIYVDGKDEQTEWKSRNELGEYQILKEELLQMKKKGDTLVLTRSSLNFNPAESTEFTKVMIYISDIEADTVMMDVGFVSDEETQWYERQEYGIYRDAYGQYINLFMPANQPYSQIYLKFYKGHDMYREARYIRANRIRTARYVTVEQFLPNYINTTVRAEDTGYLVVLQSCYPMWHAYLDGKETGITKINGAFMGIKVNPGIHQIEFKFVPWDFYVGATLSVLYALVMIITLIVERQRKMHEEKIGKEAKT